MYASFVKCLIPTVTCKKTIHIWKWLPGVVFNSTYKLILEFMSGGGARGQNLGYSSNCMPGELHCPATDLMFNHFSERNKAWHFIWFVCEANYSHEMSSLSFSEKLYKEKIKILSAAVAIGALRVKYSCFSFSRSKIHLMHNVPYTESKGLDH